MEWLGKVPSHWEVRRLKSAVVSVNDLSRAARNAHPYVALEHVEIWTGRVRAPKEPVQFDSQVKRFKRDDVLFGKLRPYLAKVTRLSESGVCVGEFLVLRPRPSGLTPAYLEQLLRSSCVIGEVNSWTFGAKMPRADWNIVGNLRVAFPPCSEQVGIVRFLDHADRGIRRLISAKRKLIALLNEQKEAIINRAVTRGLDPNVRLKPSGVEWLADVPERWEVLRTKYLFREVDCRSLSGEETHLSMSQKHGLIPSSQIEERRLLSESYAGGKLCGVGDLVLNRLKAHLGVVALAGQQGIVSPDYTVFRAIRPMEPRYFELVLRTPACRVELRKRAKGIVQGFWRLYADDFYDIRLPVPSVPEQVKTVAELDLALATTTAALEATEREISLLREYRTRLIGDVVTGKLDVREAAARLPDEAEDSDLASMDEDLEVEGCEENLEAEAVLEEIEA